MLTPTTLHRFHWFHAFGNAPAINLARSIPHGQDASVLSLGRGDLSSILYTSYVQQGLPGRKLDFTCCNDDENITGHSLARNLVLLTMILAEEEETSNQVLWDLYYHMYLDKQTTEIVIRHVRNVIPMLESLETFNNGPYGSILKICDENTLCDVRGALQRILGAAHEESRDEQATKPPHSHHYWNEVVAMINGKNARAPNPLLAGLVSDWKILHCGSDPVLSFHLAAAFTNLTANSPLRHDGDDEERRVVAAARSQFVAWVRAFKSARDTMCVRFVVSDPFALSHTLQYADAAGQLSANWYRRQWDSRVLRLDEVSYGHGGRAPTSFDAIDTSNLSEDFGLLNVLVSAGPLLAARPWATLLTENSMSNCSSEKQPFEQLLHGSSSSLSLLLGLVPLQSSPTRFPVCLSWKRDDQLGDYNVERPKVHMNAKEVIEMLFQIYLDMFEAEIDKSVASQSENKSQNQPRFHCGSFMALLKLIQSRVKTDWNAVIDGLLRRIEEERTLSMAERQAQDLRLQIALVNIRTMGETGTVQIPSLLCRWKHVPPVVAVTLVVPRDALRVFFPEPYPTWPVPTVVGTLKSSGIMSKRRYSVFDDVHVAFGRVTTTGDLASGDATVGIEQDELCWSGTSPLVATFLVPTSALAGQPVTDVVGLDLIPLFFTEVLGVSHRTVYETTTSDITSVFITKLMPGTTAHKITSGGVRPLKDEVTGGDNEARMILMAELCPDERGIAALSALIQVSSESCKKDSQNKPPFELYQNNPFSTSIRLGKKSFICPFRYPVPLASVVSETGWSGVGRTSAYIKVVASLADPRQSSVLKDCLSPTMISPSGLPVAVNLPHLNLDNLPVIELSQPERLAWLSTLTSLQVPRHQGGNTKDVRAKFTETLSAMFRACSGTRKSQTCIFSLSGRRRGDIQAMIFASAVRLDGDTASVVLDAAILALTSRFLTTGESAEFLKEMKLLDVLALKVDDEEMALWKKTIPSLIERCRTWNHRPSCEYTKQGATVPLSLEPERPWICSCGNGRMPDDFIAVPLWDVAAKHAVRIAISPMYYAPRVEPAANGVGLETSDSLSTA
ncbi:hypothetical protein CCMA1212_000313 [Trichoderma ghanense]|uniref:DUF4470 domain-containing protein n=1 Tax=Trichoderma ghanense TaxID=65468 RepID=A0ABY2HG33_9HYPO